MVGKSKPRMLFVNDERFVLMAYENQFKTTFDVTTAENGQLAFEIVKSHPVDYFKVIVLDINMPIMNGFKACDRIYSYLMGDDLRLKDFKLRLQIEEQQMSKSNFSSGSLLQGTG